MDDLSIALCIAIGTGVPWLLAVYSEGRARQLPANVIFGLTGTVVAAFCFMWITPVYMVAALVVAGPPIAYASVVGGQLLARILAGAVTRQPG